MSSNLLPIKFHRYAMFEMAENLLRGTYVSPDPLRALHFLEKASSLGHVNATWTLGQLLITGSDGVLRDIKRGKAMVTAALQADPSIAKKVFVPYTQPALQAASSVTTEPVSSTPVDTQAAAKAPKPPRSPVSLSYQTFGVICGVAVVGVAVVASLLFARMRRK